MELKDNTIEIEREGGELDIVTFSFRFTDLSSTEIAFVQTEIGDRLDFINEPEIGKFITAFPITKDIDTSTVIKIIDKLNLTNEKYGLWISHTTEYDHSGFRLPKLIRDFYLKVGGEFNVSIIMI